jgi:hypothetical protein
MVWLYSVCAIVGGTLFLAQLVLSLCGLGGDQDVVTETDHDVGGDHGADHSVDHGDHSHHAFGLHGMFTFRAIVAGMMFFGLAGLAANQSQWGTLAALGTACGVGFVALAIVGILIETLFKMEAQGNVRIEQALGERADVYLTVPAKGGGTGKVQLTVQQRVMEYPAVTDGNVPLPTGMKVEVVDLVDGGTLKVAPLKELEGKSNA